ncbi:hypothetical protein [Singulisphaera sp. PoT]|uniref:hypothetical protein n=1 Tax=Singulisphaera sp. PoT TaxID=3411797 RepID=UPI003BF5CDD3
MADLAEVVYLGQGLEREVSSLSFRRTRETTTEIAQVEPFTRLDGRWMDRELKEEALFEAVGEKGGPTFRRLSDGMRCVRLPSVSVEIGDGVG